MTPAELPVSPPDISAILTSLGVFSLAIAAVVGGIYKGIKELRNDTGTPSEPREPGQSVQSYQLVEVLRSLDRHCVLLIEALQDSRAITRSQIEEQHRVRAAMVDLVELLRRR